MYKARYHKSDGASTGEQSLPEWLFDGKVHESAMHQVVKAYQANQRQGTASAKTRSDVKGGSKKPWRQKGTGRARAGTIRSPLWEGGGVAFPPIPHSWRQRVPRKVRALARRSALNSRAGGERVMVIDTIQMDAPKTKELIAVLDKMGVEGKALVLTHGVNENVFLSSRNLPHVETRPFGQESVYDILWANIVIIEKEALEAATPSRADTEAQATNARGSEPEVRTREREEAEAQVERKKARMGHDKAAKPAVVKAAPEAKASASPKAEKKAAKAPAAEESGDDIASVKLPNIGDLAAFLADYDDAADVAALQNRDSRKTAQAHYEARLAELSGSSDSDGAVDEEE